MKQEVRNFVRMWRCLRDSNTGDERGWLVRQGVPFVRVKGTSICCPLLPRASCGHCPVGENCAEYGSNRWMWNHSDIERSMYYANRMYHAGRKALRELYASEARERILDTFIELTRSKAYPFVTISELATSAGVSRQLVYHYFRNAQWVLDAAMERAVEENIEHLLVQGAANGYVPRPIHTE